MGTCHILKHRVIALLNREEVDFLDKVDKDILFSTGHKFSRSQIIRTLVRFLMELDVNVKGIRNEKKFAERILVAVKDKLKDSAMMPPSPKGILTKKQNGFENNCGSGTFEDEEKAEG